MTAWPTAVHAETSVQATPDSGRAKGTATVLRSADVLTPVWVASTATPARESEATVVPTATQGPAAQVTERRSATEAGTATGSQVVPPSMVTASTPRPVRAAPVMVAVVPTAAQTSVAVAEALDTDDVDPGWAGPHQTLWRCPMAVGTLMDVHVAPPSVVRAPAATPCAVSGVAAPVAQHRWVSGQASPEADTSEAGRGPAAGQVAAHAVPEPRLETSAVICAELAARAVHRWSERQATALMSVTPGGRVAGVQASPPSVVTRSVPTRPDCPPATQRRLSVHETEESAVTPGGRAGTVQVRAPSAVVAITAPPDVADPTATHLVAVEHDTAVSVLTVGGTKLAVSAPVKAEGGWVEVVDAGVVGVEGSVLEVDDVEPLEPHPVRPVALMRRATTDAAIAGVAPLDEWRR